MHSHNLDNNYLLSDSTLFVHIFYDKDNFTNFKRAIRGQGLLYRTEVIIIEG